MKIVIKNIQAILPDGAGSDKIEKASVEKLSHLREEIENMNSRIQIAQREGDYEKAAELSYGKLPELKKQLEMVLKH